MEKGMQEGDSGGKGCRERDEEAGDQMTKEWFQLPPKRCNVFCFVECARQPVPEGASQHCRMTSRQSAFSLCSHWIQRCLVCTGKKSGENEMDCKGKQVPVHIVVQFHARAGTWERGFCIQSVWRQATSAATSWGLNPRPEWKPSFLKQQQDHTGCDHILMCSVVPCVWLWQ